MNLFADEYRIAISPNRGRRGGFRVQVYVIGLAGHEHAILAEAGHLPGRRVGLWRASFRGAMHCGLSEVYDDHDRCAAPLVVWLDGATVVDDRVAVR